MKIFDFFTKKVVKEDDTNVVKFPELNAVPKYEPEPEKPATVFYRLGVTDSNRVSFQMGYSEITMTKLGVEQLINQLEVFKNQLHDGPTDD